MWIHHLLIPRTLQIREFFSSSSTPWKSHWSGLLLYFLLREELEIDGWMDEQMHRTDRKMNNAFENIFKVLWLSKFSLAEYLLSSFILSMKISPLKSKLSLSQDPSTTLFLQRLYNCVFNHYFNHLWYMYKLNFSAWIQKQSTDYDKNAKVSLKIKILLLKKLYWRMWHRYITTMSFVTVIYCFITPTPKIGNLKEQKSFSLLVNLQPG